VAESQCLIATSNNGFHEHPGLLHEHPLVELTGMLSNPDDALLTLLGLDK
jgi:hypothetical protein